MYLDAASGRVSLRNISDPALASPEYDLILEVRGPSQGAQYSVITVYVRWNHYE